MTAVLAWFTLDTGLSAYQGAWFNVLLVNLPCGLALGVPLLALRPYFAPSGASQDAEPSTAHNGGQSGQRNVS